MSPGKATSSRWVADPLHVRPIAHAIWDPQFGQGAIDAFTQAGASYAVDITYSGVYHWWYTIGMRSNLELYQGSLFMLILSAWALFAGWLHLQPKFRPSLAWFKNAEARLNHHLAVLFGFSSIAWTGHLVTWPSLKPGVNTLVGTTSSPPCPTRLVGAVLHRQLGGVCPKSRHR